MANEQTHLARFVEARLSDIAVSGWMRTLLATLGQPDGNRQTLEQILDLHGLSQNEAVRKEIIDLVLQFVEESLRQGGLTDSLIAEIKEMKLFLDVREGEFFNYRPVEISEILIKQLNAILDDFIIDRREDLYQVELQAAFDLGYDQYFALTRRAFEEAVELWDAQIRQAQASHQGDVIATLKDKREELEPFVKLALAQQRTIGGLY
jgi:hypothetical protein